MYTYRLYFGKKEILISQNEELKIMIIAWGDKDIFSCESMPLKSKNSRKQAEVTTQKSSKYLADENQTKGNQHKDVSKSL